MKGNLTTNNLCFPRSPTQESKLPGGVLAPTSGAGGQQGMDWNATIFFSLNPDGD